MKAFVLAAETITDQAKFDAYRKEVPATIEPFGGKFVARGGTLSVPAEDWYKSDAYQKIISLRHKSSNGNLIIVDGLV